MTVSPFSPFLLHCLDSEPPGMIINLIIKHLLPTAPALFPLDPPGPHHREREGERGRRRRRAGDGGRDTGGARGRGWREESSKSEGVIITLLDSFTPTRSCVFLCGGRQRVKLCDPRTKETRRTEQSDARKELEGHIAARAPPPPTESDICNELINQT